MPFSIASRASQLARIRCSHLRYLVEVTVQQEGADAENGIDRSADIVADCGQDAISFLGQIAELAAQFLGFRLHGRAGDARLITFRAHGRHYNRTPRTSSKEDPHTGEADRKPKHNPSTATDLNRLRQKQSSRINSSRPLHVSYDDTR